MIGHHVIAGVCALAVTAGCTDDRADEPGDAVSYASELDRTDRAIQQLTAVAAERPGDWLIRERLAAAYLGRARLSGDYDDYAAADAALDEAFAIAPAGGGPHLLRARVDLTLHRFADVDRSLTAATGGAIVPASRQRATRDLRGELAFHVGDYAAAREHFAVSVDTERAPAALFRLALYHWRTGDYDGAEVLFREAELRHHSASPGDRAWYHLQLGLMDLDRGRYADALDHYRDGAGLVSGWWLLEEHMAEALAALGRESEAVELYDKVVAETGSPELMDALASLTGDADLADRARRGFEDRLARFPEASYGHAFDHFLATDPVRALDLALANLTLRPGAPARIALAQAHLRLGRPGPAEAALTPALKTPWRSAELFATAAIIYRRLGNHDDAADFESIAVGINPDAMNLAFELAPL